MKSRFNLAVIGKQPVASIETIIPEVFIFSGGEVQVKVPYISTKTSYVCINADLRDAEGILTLAMIKDALEQQEVECVHLNMPYVPYARQDRVCNDGEAFSLKVFCNMINNMNFTKVYICDPHSDVTPALLNNVIINDQCDLYQDVMFNKKASNYILVSPDAGANKKTLALAKLLRHDTFIRADKIRDVSNGQIRETVVYGDVAGKNCMIVDDICDGGTTFIFLAQELKKKGAKEVYLYATHGIFSKGKQVLYDAGIDEVYTYSDWEEN